jgi:GNAT superfamily N-acetyltransferase
VSLGILPESRKKINLDRLEIKPLDSSMNRAAFCCCEPELCDFFREHAELHHNDYSARVHVAVYEGDVVGYYWLIAQSHLAGMFSSELESKFERIVFAPCIYLGMLAVRWDLQGNKIGYALMMHAFGQTLKAAEHVGVYALTLEAIDESKAKTYEKWNFQRFVDGKLDMYIPIATIRRLLAGIAA